MCRCVVWTTHLKILQMVYLTTIVYNKQMEKATLVVYEHTFWKESDSHAKVCKVNFR